MAGRRTVYTRDEACTLSGAVFEIDSGYYRSSVDQFTFWVQLNQGWLHPSGQLPWFTRLQGGTAYTVQAPGRFGIVHAKTFRTFSIGANYQGGEQTSPDQSLWWITVEDADYVAGVSYTWTGPEVDDPASGWSKWTPVGPVYSWPQLVERRPDSPYPPPVFP